MYFDFVISLDFRRLNVATMSNFFFLVRSPQKKIASALPILIANYTLRNYC